MAENSELTENSEYPLCVDLDGTLIFGDITIDSIPSFFRIHPLRACKAIFLLLKGRSHFKHEMSKYVHVNPENLPYNECFLDFLRKEN